MRCTGTTFGFTDVFFVVLVRVGEVQKRGKGWESWSLCTRGGVGESACMTSSSESRISSMSMNRPDAFGGVAGGSDMLIDFAFVVLFFGSATGDAAAVSVADLDFDG